MDKSYLVNKHCTRLDKTIRYDINLRRECWSEAYVFAFTINSFGGVSRGCRCKYGNANRRFSRQEGCKRDAIQKWRWNVSRQ